VERYDKELETWPEDDGDGISRADWQIIEDDILAEKTTEQLVADIDALKGDVLRQIAQFKRLGKDGLWYGIDNSDVDSHL
jgi:hypothetical protein